MSEHTITVELGPYGPYAEMTCTAPETADCRRRFVCGCETWFRTGVEDGRPYHIPGDYSENLDERHYGVFDPSWCNEVEWFDSCDGLDNTAGKVTLAVESKWEGEHYTWRILGGDS